jgi:VIT1/CCC1 family predicted Fe2+/Mn2+ transporter
MNRHTNHSRKQAAPRGNFLVNLIDPIDGLSEGVFSIIVFLIFTLAFKVIWLRDALEQPITSQMMNELIISAMGAILAWGIIDGMMYALTSYLAREERHRLLKGIQSADTEEEALDLIADDMDYLLEPITEEGDRQVFYRNYLQLLAKSKPQAIRVTKDDLAVVLGHILVATLAVIPSLLPLLVLRFNFDLALTVSILVSFIVLFVSGFAWGKYTGANPWRIGFLLLLVAASLVVIAMLLGG